MENVVRSMKEKKERYQISPGLTIETQSQSPSGVNLNSPTDCP